MASALRAEEEELVPSEDAFIRSGAAAKGKLPLN